MEQPARTSNRDDVVDVSEVHRRVRRPTGAPPPLPKKIGGTGVLRLALVVFVVVPGCIWLHDNPAPLDRFDAAITDAVSYPNPNVAATPLVQPQIRDDPGIYPPEAVRRLLYIDLPAPRAYEHARTRAWSRMKSGC
jgi:hypothetical protein